MKFFDLIWMNFDEALLMAVIWLIAENLLSDGYNQADSCIQAESSKVKLIVEYCLI
jgi:hypothetical protein